MRTTVGGGDVAVRVTALILPQRLPVEARRTLDTTGTPLGLILSWYGLRRHIQGAVRRVRGTEVDEAGNAVEYVLRAVLDISPGISVGIVDESLYQDFLHKYLRPPSPAPRNTARPLGHLVTRKEEK
ncbi:hypothetical protein [Longimycelium tulufanense]|uniref:hypothetical protein n=1 Tax=Longimycelium tulufanense TaxID=907463 RepID=UPI00166CDF72|nr:hypothetical protein [Longimycelium tulufanense]